MGELFSKKEQLKCSIGEGYVCPFYRNILWMKSDAISLPKTNNCGWWRN